MDTERALLAAIAEEPDDDGRKAVYADWLQQRGDPRGELIQLSLALAQMDDFDERKRATTARISALEEELRPIWLAAHKELGLDGVVLTLHQGIVSHVQGSPTSLAAAADRIVKHAPLVNGVHIDVGEVRTLDALEGSPLLERATSLSVGHFSTVRVTGWRALGALPRLRSVGLSSIAVGPEDLEAIVASPRAPKLASLWISGCRLNKGALEPLARARCAFKRFDMPAQPVGARLGELLGENPSFHSLVHLRIPGASIGASGLRALLPALANVEDLDVRGCELGSEDVSLLFDVLDSVRELRIGSNRLDDSIVERLVAWEGATKLRRLHLGSANITDTGARLLAEAPCFANLRSLVLSGPRFDHETDVALLASPHLASARIFSGNRVLPRKKALEPPESKKAKR